MELTPMMTTNSNGFKWVDLERRDHKWPLVRTKHAIVGGAVPLVPIS